MKRLASSPVFLLVLTGALLTACGDTPFAPEGVAGVYTLESINGNPLPFAETAQSTIIAGSITLNADGTVSTSFTTSVTLDGTTTTDTQTFSGTFTLVEPSTIRFAFTGEESLSGTLEGDRLTIIVDGDTQVYRK